MAAIEDVTRFVQLPHPGGEHRPVGPTMPWSQRNSHKRKFVVSEGAYITNGRVERGRAAFWAEWEPNSIVVREWPSEGRLPRFLHDPYVPKTAPRGYLHNTDPMVFGDHFAYTNCRMGRNGKLRSLAPASVVLFGSGFKEGFVLDTVFVVGGEPNPEYAIAESEMLECPDGLQKVVFDPLRRGAKLLRPTKPIPARYYRGAMYDQPIHGMFSFVPCLPLGSTSGRFARPVISLGEWINPNLRMQARCTSCSVEELTRAWQSVVSQVERAGLTLGVHFPFPRTGDGSGLNDGPAGGAGGCSY